MVIDFGMAMILRYARTSSSYECFILRASRLSSKQIKLGYLLERLKSSFRKFYGRYWDLIQQYEVSFSRMLNDILTLDLLYWHPNQSDIPQFHDLDTDLYLHRMSSGFYGAYATGVACQQGTLDLPDTCSRTAFWQLLMLQCWDQFSRLCRVFSRLFKLNTPR